MIINSHTKISQLLKENSEALNAISSLAKPLEKLRNPVLRKLMASRTTIQEAAHIGGCSVEEFFLVLRPLGFEISEAPTGQNRQDRPEAKPQWLAALAVEQISDFDVRQMLSSGHDPLREIMAEYKKIRPGTALKIINTFIPTPLLRLLENKGAAAYAEKIGERLTYSYFFKPDTAIQKQQRSAGSVAADQEKIVTVSETEFRENLRQFTEQQLKEIDVRELEMPEPMQKILKTLESLPPDGGLYVHHKRIPVYLLEDLQASGKYRVFILPIAETRVDLLLTPVRVRNV